MSSPHSASPPRSQEPPAADRPFAVCQPSGDLTLVIPAYNEAASLPSFLPAVLTAALERGWQVVIVNDGSRDATGQILEEHQRSSVVRIIHHKVNRGYGGAIKSGIRASTTRYVITIDADGQHDLGDVARLHDEILTRDADMIIGSRPLASSGWYRELGKSLIRAFARLLMPLPVRDLNSGMKIYNADLARQYLPLCPDHMAFSDIIALLFINEKHRVLEVPIHVHQRLAGVSTINAMTAYETVKELLNMIVLFNPTRVFWTLALVSLVVGGAWGIPIVLRGHGVSVCALLAVVTGLIFFSLGLIAEQVSLIRRRGH
jgi:glycosyltransferase involved in cell wall biosynthesis